MLPSENITKFTKINRSKTVLELLRGASIKTLVVFHILWIFLFLASLLS